MFDKLFNMTEDDVSIIYELTRNQGITSPNLISFYLNVGRVIGKDKLFQRMSVKPLTKNEMSFLVGAKVVCEDFKVRTITNVASIKGVSIHLLIEFDDEPNVYVSFDEYGKPMSQRNYRIYLIDHIDLLQPTNQESNVPEYLEGIPLLTEFEQDDD